MSFISVGAAIGSAASAIASGVGAVAGSIGGTVASGLGALGMGTAAAPSALASGIGSLVGGATTGGAIGSGMGAATSAITGGDPGKGAAMGAITGGATGGLGSLLGGAGGAGGSAAQAVGGVQGTGSSFIEQAAKEGLGATAQSAVPAGSTAQSLASSAAPVLDNTASAALSSGAGSLGKEAVKLGAPEMLKGFTGGTTFTGDAGKEQEAKEAQGSQWAADTYQQPGGSWLPGKAEGGVATIRAARGGSVRLKNGDYVVPADVVSALGNGSTKAGAKYLNHLFTAISAGPAPKAGSLAKQRAKARHAA